MTASELITPAHLHKKAVIYTLSRDFVGSNENLPPHREPQPSLQ